MKRKEMPVSRRREDDESSDEAGPVRFGAVESYTGSLIIQGAHRFHIVSMHSDLLAQTCVVLPRDENPEEGFQRKLDLNRAKQIAAYIDDGFGTIPTAIVLSAQPEADFEYSRKLRTIRFKITPRSFLIIDGQHRVFGFRLAKTRIKVPVHIYSNLSRSQEARLFMDINTKQRPVPNELLLDIRRMADAESGDLILFRDVFDLFHGQSDSPLFGFTSSASKTKGKLTRVSFNAALRPIADTFGHNDARYVYDVLSAYLGACMAGLRRHGAAENIANPILFRALILLFPLVAERVEDRHGGDYSADNFSEIMGPFFTRVKKSDLQKSRTSHRDLHDTFVTVLRQGFTLGRAR